MDMIPRNDYGERCQFDAYCKLVLYHEAIDYLREMQRRRDRELSFSDLPQMEMDKLCVVDHYPSDRFTFSSHGYDLHIENELVADAFAGLSVQEQSILILHFVLDLPDQEVGRLVGMSRSAVQRRRAKSLTELRIKLAALILHLLWISQREAGVWHTTLHPNGYPGGTDPSKSAGDRVLRKKP